MADRLRWLLVGISLLALLAMMSHYGAVRADRFPYTPTSELEADYGAHIGEETYFWAHVTRTEPDRFLVDNYAIELWVIESPAGLSEGDVVQVYGTVQPDQRIESHRVVVSPRPNRLFMFAISGLAGLLVAGMTLRYWRIDLESLTIRERHS